MSKKYLDYHQREEKPPVKKFWTNKKINFLAVVGVLSAVGYYSLKKKILGSPPSKIRKGLMYASLAGVILYKCENEKVVSAYEYIEDKVEYRKEQVNKKNNYLELKNQLELKEKTLELKVEELTEKNKILFRREREIEDKKVELENMVDYIDKRAEIIEYETRKNENFLSKNNSNIDEKINYKSHKKDLIKNDNGGNLKKNEKQIKTRSKYKQRYISQAEHVELENFIRERKDIVYSDDTIRTIIKGTDQKLINSKGLYVDVIKKWVDLNGNVKTSYNRIYFDGK